MQLAATRNEASFLPPRCTTRDPGIGMLGFALKESTPTHRVGVLGDDCAWPFRLHLLYVLFATVVLPPHGPVHRTVQVHLLAYFLL